MPGAGRVEQKRRIAAGGRSTAMVGHMSTNADRTAPLATALSAESSVGIKLLPIALSVIAGSADAIGFLGLGGLFTAHVTGNLVMLAAHLVNGGDAPVAAMLAVPVFMAALASARAVVSCLERIGTASLQPLLVLQFLLLAGFLVLSVSADPPIDPNAGRAVLAGMLGVSAMAVQNALVQISLKGAPSTAVMTSNITRFMLDIVSVMLGRDQADIAKARSRAGRTGPVIVGFTVGCGVGAACESVIGLWALALPTGLALLVLAMGPAAEFDDGQGS
ncbi:MAG: YoaK family protein [Aliidongia sp.]